MASELRVNTLKDASGNNSIATSFVARGSAKGWINFDGTATFDGSDTEIRDSFNITSTIDNDPGIYTMSYTSVFSDADYSPTTGAGGSGYTDRHLTLSVLTSSSLKVVEQTESTTQDVLICTVHSLGDLA